jgi:hypothetical protein
MVRALGRKKQTITMKISKSNAEQIAKKLLEKKFALIL